MKFNRNPSRFRKEKGVDFDPYLLFNLEQAAKQTVHVPNVGPVPKYYLHMGTINKVGIRPTTSYGDTPLGLYAYPLNTIILGQLIEGDLPYLSYAKHFTILELVDPEHCLVVDSYQNGFIDMHVFSENNDTYRRVKSLLPSVDDTPRATIFRRALLNLGHTSVLSFNGAIHLSEPQQIVFLIVKAFKIVFSSETTTLMRLKRDYNRLHKKVQKIISNEFPRFNEPLLGLSIEAWNKILMLWTADLIDQIRPNWEKWAGVKIPEYQNLGEQVSEGIRGFANGTMTIQQLDSIIDYSENGRLNNPILFDSFDGYRAKRVLNLYKRALLVMRSEIPPNELESVFQAAFRSWDFGEERWSLIKRSKRILVERIQTALNEKTKLRKSRR